MIEQVQRTNYNNARKLFAGEYLTLIIDSVIAETSTGLLWADDPGKPRTALLWDEAHTLYLVGDAEDPTTNQQLADRFVAQIVPAARARKIDMFKIHYSNPGWENALATIVPSLKETQYPRVVYTLGAAPLPDWRSQLPDGFALRLIDRAMLRDQGLGNLDDLLEEIEQCWPSQERFLANGFGCCLVGNGDIICRCTAEYVSPGKCGIGIATAEKYRRQGYASLTASAFVEECQRRQIVPYWDAWLRNTASVATADKIGLRRIHEYSVYLLSLEE